jgi:SIR2-like domain
LSETARRQNQVLARLQKALNDRSLVIIVGAGVTLSATADASGKPLPRTTWTGLVRNGLDYILEGDYLDASNRRIRRAYEALEDNDRAGLLDAANTMKDLLVQLRQYPTWLESVFGSLHQEVRRPAIFDVLKALHGKGATLLTTNYDDLLERFCNLRRIGRSNTDDILKFKRGDLDGVFHIHGSYQDPHEVVLDTVNYYQVMQSDEVQNILKTFLEFKTVLFVGCGLGLQDPNFDALLRWASERQQNISNRHCLLIRNEDTLNYSPLIRLKYGADYQDLVPYLYKLLGDASQPANVAGSAPTGVSRQYSNITEHSVASIADLTKRPEREPSRLDSAGMNQFRCLSSEPD